MQSDLVTAQAAAAAAEERADELARKVDILTIAEMLSGNKTESLENELESALSELCDAEEAHSAEVASLQSDLAAALEAAEEAELVANAASSDPLAAQLEVNPASGGLGFMDAVYSHSNCAIDI